MAKVVVKNVSLTYPIYGNSSRSIKSDVVRLLAGKTSSSKNYISEVKALQNISFELSEGDNLGLIGHNGAGKSTLLRVLAGIYRPNMGVVSIRGSISALLGNSIGLQPELNAYENIKIACIIRKSSKKEMESIIKDVAEFTELGDFLSLPVKLYSAGMQARLAFAISTAISPDILLLDEVVGAGDAKFIEKANARTDHLLNKANILVLASHDNNIIKKFCNKAVWLEHGKIQMIGNTSDTINAYMNSFALES